MRLDQRAWVGFSDETIMPATDETGKFFKLGLTIKNTGKTPALNVAVEYIITPARGDTPPTWEEIEKHWNGTLQESGSPKVYKDYFVPGVGLIESLKHIAGQHLGSRGNTNMELQNIWPKE
jgi:hypothetical protein